MEVLFTRILGIFFLLLSWFPIFLDPVDSKYYVPYSSFFNNHILPFNFHNVSFELQGLANLFPSVLIELQSLALKISGLSNSWWKKSEKNQTGKMFPHSLQLHKRENLCIIKLTLIKWWLEKFTKVSIFTLPSSLKIWVKLYLSIILFV